MEDFESAVTKAVEDGVVVGGAAIGVTKDGSIRYQKAFGKTGLDDGARSMQYDSVVFLASATKLLTSICVMQCVERGQLELDAPISNLLAEWTNPDILTGYDSEGKPTTTKANTPITLRMLLTHSSGMSYAFIDPVLQKYYRAVGRDPMRAREIEKDWVMPLLFEPGTSWSYGCGIDWAGKMVERANKTSLGQYMKTHVFDVLDMTSSVFQIDKSPDIKARLCDTFTRNPDGKISALDPAAMFTHGDTDDDFGGGGLYSCAADYSKVLASLLSDDGKLLKPETTKLLLAPSLSDAKRLNETIDDGPWGAIMAPGIPLDGAEFNYSLGGCVVVSGIPEQGQKNIVFWSGGPNSQWYIDRERGVAGFYATQIYPPGDAPSQELYAKFRKGMYAMT